MRLRLTIAILTSVLLMPRAALGFCRTSTCAAGGESSCERDESGCLIGGKPLVWSGGCVSFSVQANGSSQLGIGYDPTLELVTTAFDRWTNVACDGGAPSITVQPTAGAASCGRPEHNANAPNANVWMFEDSHWAHAANVLAVTTVTFDDATGAILDADVELNGLADLALDAAAASGLPGYDLPAVVQHESGHFLGLSHSGVHEATMWRVVLRGDTEPRSLHDDDVAAICAAYPPERAALSCDFAPRNGWSAECQSDPGCSTQARGTRLADPRAACIALLLLACAVRRRAASRNAAT